MIHFALRRAQNIHWQALDVNKAARAALKGQKPCGAVVHRPVGRRQVDHRQPGREAAARARPAHLPARRRQRPPRPEPGPRLHRRRPRREHPPRRRGGEADGRRRPDRAGVVHLAVPRRAAHGARAVRARASSSRSSSTRRSTMAEQRDRRACTRRRGAASSRTSPASTRPTRRPSIPRSTSTRPGTVPRNRLPRSSSSCARKVDWARHPDRWIGPPDRAGWLPRAAWRQNDAHPGRPDDQKTRSAPCRLSFGFTARHAGARSSAPRHCTSWAPGQLCRSRR